MAFPSYPAGHSPGVLAEATSVTSHPVPYATCTGGILANDILLIFIGTDAATAGITHTFPGDWNRIANGSPVAGTCGGAVAWKRAAGGETGTVTVTTDVSDRSAAHMVILRGAHTTSAPEASAMATGTTANADPPSLSPSWGAEDTRWFAFKEIDISTIATAGPAGYSGFTTVNATSAGFIAYAYRDLNAASENPGAFTTAANEWVAWTIAIRPAPAGGGQLTGNLGQVSETDTVNALSRRKQKGILQQLVTETVQSIGRRKQKAFSSSVVEADLRNALSSRKQKTLGVLDETGTLFPITPQLQGGDIVLGVQDETDTPQPLTSRKSKSIAQIGEADSTFPVTRRKRVTLGLITESVTLFSVGKRKSKTLSQSIEADIAFSVASLALIIGELGLLTETDIVDIPEPAGLTRRKRKTIGQNLEANTLQPITRRKQKTLGLITEGDVVQPVAVRTRIVRTLGLLVDTETAWGLFVQRGAPLEPRPRYHLGTSGSRVYRRAGR